MRLTHSDYATGAKQKNLILARTKAIGQIQLENGEVLAAEIHWYEEPTIGKVEFKCKKEL